MIKLPEKLVKLRKHYRYSQKFLANYLQVDVLRYMSFENGAAVPSFREIQRLAALYRIQTLVLFREDEKIIFHDPRFPQFQQLWNKLWLWMKKNRKTLLLSTAVFALALTIFFAWRPNEKEYVPPTVEAAETFAASDTSVVWLQEGKLQGRGDNSNGQFNLQENDILKVTEGATFTVALRKNGQVISSGLLQKYENELASYRQIYALAAGKGHILLLDSGGNVFCVGDNTYGQCDFKKKTGVKRIFALDSASVIVANDGEIEVSGNVFGKSRIEKQKNIIDIAASDKFIIYVMADGKVGFETRGKDFSEVLTWTDMKQVVATNDFVAALGNNGKVRIAIDNYMIQDAVSAWSDIRAIASGRDYLVASNGERVWGVGKNTYHQFESNSALRNSLPSVKNVQLDMGNDKLTIRYQPVTNALAYLVAIDVGTGFSIRTEETSVQVDTRDFIAGKTYLLHITALGEGIYENSETLSLEFVYQPKETTEKTPRTETPNLVEVPFSLERLTGKTRVNLEAYLTGLGVKSENLTSEAGTNHCSGEEATVETISGVNDYERITKAELAKRHIHYTYCQIEKPGES